MRLTGQDEAKIKWSPAAHQPFAPQPAWWTIARSSANAENEVRPGGPSSGVVGGVSGVVSGGVPGRTRTIEGEVKDRISGKVSDPSGKEETSKLTGTVSDPSGGRIAHAVVSLIGRAGGFDGTVATDDNGEFVFASVPKGQYRIVVKYPMFERAEAPVKVPGAGKEVSLNVIMGPSNVVESAVVRAKRPGGVSKNPASTQPSRFHAGGQLEQPKLLYRPQPNYPDSASSKGVEGTVVMEAVISTEGVPLSVKVVQSPDEALSKAALEAVKQWRYQPTKLNGVPVEVVTDITVRFTLEN